ncbi:hypothetical protein RKD23_007840 [Streptomyces sp. SAI-170]
MRNRASAAIRFGEICDSFSRPSRYAPIRQLPVDDWLAPGERELLHGVDFHAPPAVTLRLLRGKARRSGLHLNSRATAGRCGCAPRCRRPRTLGRRPPSGPQSARHPGPVPCPAARGFPSIMTAGAGSGVRTATAAVSMPTTTRRGRSACGSRRTSTGWVTCPWSRPSPPSRWRRLVYKVAKMPHRENHYDFRSWSHLGEPEETANNVRAYLLQHDFGDEPVPQPGHLRASSTCASVSPSTDRRAYRASMAFCVALRASAPWLSGTPSRRLRWPAATGPAPAGPLRVSWPPHAVVSGGMSPVPAVQRRRSRRVRTAVFNATMNTAVASGTRKGVIIAPYGWRHAGLVGWRAWCGGQWHG